MKIGVAIVVLILLMLVLIYATGSSSIISTTGTNFGNIVNAFRSNGKPQYAS